MDDLVSSRPNAEHWCICFTIELLLPFIIILFYEAWCCIIGKQIIFCTITKAILIWAIMACFIRSDSAYEFTINFQFCLYQPISPRLYSVIKRSEPRSFFVVWSSLPSMCRPSDLPVVAGLWHVRDANSKRKWHVLVPSGHQVGYWVQLMAYL